MFNFEGIIILEIFKVLLVGTMSVMLIYCSLFKEIQERLLRIIYCVTILAVSRNMSIVGLTLLSTLCLIHLYIRDKFSLTEEKSTIVKIVDRYFEPKRKSSSARISLDILNKNRKDERC